MSSPLQHMLHSNLYNIFWLYNYNYINITKEGRLCKMFILHCQLQKEVGTHSNILKGLLDLIREL